MKLPLVSIIFPTYNREHIIDRAIESVLNQTYNNIELIIVDDASDDNTEAVVKSFNDKRIMYIRHNRNKGCASARNTGINAAKGRYIAFQDDDDVWVRDKLEKQMEVMLNVSPQVGVVYSPFKRIKNNRQFIIPDNSISNKEGYILRQLLTGNFINLQVALVKKECFDTIGLFDEELLSLSDWDLWIRIAKHYEFAFFEEPLAYVYDTKNSIMKNHRTWINAQRKILATYKNDFLELGKEVLAQKHFELGRRLHKIRLRKESRISILHALNLNKKTKYYVGYILTFFPYFSVYRNSPF